MPKLKVGLLGATGCVGQTYQKHLINHPFFELCFLGASEQSAGLTLKQALKERNQGLPRALDSTGSMPLHLNSDLDKALEQCDFLFSALDSSAAKKLEPQFAEAGLPVISNSSSHRMDPDVPVLVPEVNLPHLDLLSIQQRNRKWHKGFIITKSNCSLLSYLLPLYPLHLKFGVTDILVTTLQSVSGAGYHGLSALESMDNVIPYIPQEEEKSAQEFMKIMGTMNKHSIQFNDSIRLSVQCTRVPITRGHLASVSVRFKTPPTLAAIRTCWENYKGPESCQNLPSSPKKLIIYNEEPMHPQPSVDLSPNEGMSAFVGRLRPCPVLDYRFVSLTDNLQRGAAQAGLYMAEILVKKNLLCPKIKKNLELLRTL